MGPDRLGFNYAAPGKGMSQDAWIVNAKATGHPDYARYVQLAGTALQSNTDCTRYPASAATISRQMPIFS
jgi:hypothetical protein